MARTGSAERGIPTRRVSFEASLRDLPPHFAVDGDLILSHLAATLSGLFPGGEDFFVRSVRRVRGRITDPDLGARVAGFLGQEAVHGREHRVLNEHLARLGYPTRRVEWLTRRFLGLRSRVAPPTANLALTAALEHVTATLAELLLSRQDVRDLFAHDGVRELFLWHALEECEHKAVAFDVYTAVGGSERLRVWTMHVLRHGFVALLALHVALSVLGDRAAYRPGALRASWRRLRRSPLARRALWDRLGDYTRPGFHPDDRDTGPLVAHWRAALFGEVGAPAAPPAA